MRVYIKNERMPEELLAFLGYGEIQKEGDGLYRVSRMGIPHPDIVRENDKRKETGAAVYSLKKEAGISDEDFARVLLLGRERADDVLAGRRALSGTEMTIAAGLFRVEKAALMDGVIKMLPDLEKELASCRELLSRIKETLQGELEKAGAFSGNRRFFVRPDKNGTYRIYDAVLMDYVRMPQGPVSFDDPVKALEGAYDYEHGYGMPIPVKENPGVPLDLPGYLYAEKVDGLIFVFDSRQQEADGSDRLLGVVSTDGQIMTVGEAADEDLLPYAAVYEKRKEAEKEPEPAREPESGISYR